MENNLSPCSPTDPPIFESSDQARKYAHCLANRPEEATALEELQKQGLLIDIASDLKSESLLLGAIESIQERFDFSLNDSEYYSTANYFLANAWEGLRLIRRQEWALHEWEQSELDSQVVLLRSALQSESFGNLEEGRQCQVLTNLANVFSHNGRIIEAVRYWDQALEIDSSFPNAKGNRAYGLFQHARHLEDHGHKILHFKEALYELHMLLDSDDPRLNKSARSVFEGTYKSIQSIFRPDYRPKPLTSSELSTEMPEDEKHYRRWCLSNKLFLNDLNELPVGGYAAADVLCLPAITTDVMASQPAVIGLFNQMKQEYASARYFLYESQNESEVHFSDRDVVLVNTLDYPVYGLATEKLKAAFRIAYSIFDKIAFLLNEYLELRIRHDRVGFRSIWFNNGDAKAGLRSALLDPKYRSLKALFWLSKELHSKDPSFTNSIEPEGREISIIRNHIEHKYFKLHEIDPPDGPGSPMRMGFEELAFSNSVHSFQNKVMRLLSLTREGLIYTTQVIYELEYCRNRESEGVVAPMVLSVFEDEWKRRL